MFKFLMLLFMVSTWASASYEEQIFSDRREMVKGLTEFISELEKNHGLKVTYDTSGKRWTVISEAWADGPYDCFYAGWPSNLKSIGGKRYCQQPQKQNTHFSNGTCKSTELQCQPQLFGKNLCIPFSTPSERQTSYSRCEEKFKSSPQSNFKFVEAYTPEDFERLREMTALADDICEQGKLGVQKSSSMCQKLKSRIQKHFKSFVHGTELKVSLAKPSEEHPQVNSRTSESSLLSKQIARKKDPDCVTCGPQTKSALPVSSQLLNQTHEINEVVSKIDDPVKAVYLRVKEKFLSSDFCKPEKLFAQDEENPSPLLLNWVVGGKSGVGKIFDAQSALSVDQKLEHVRNYLSPESTEYIQMRRALEKTREMVLKNHYDQHHYANAAKLLFIKGMQKLEKEDPEKVREIYLEQLAVSNIFHLGEEEDAVPSCPFISEDAFRKAYEGFQKIRTGDDVKKKNQLTVVDYTMPSNHRRMFVMDLTEGKEDVLHNTWTAHGSGENGEGTQGTDGLGSSPKTGQSGSKLTRQGFMVMGGEFNSPTWGPSLKIYGKDLYNRGNPPKDKYDNKMISDTVWLHGWGSPSQTYLNNPEDVKNSLNVALDPSDPDFDVRKVNLAFSRASQGAALGYKLAPTYGCLGVPITPIKRLDKKGRDINQLEALRQDLPGSVLLAYTGEDQKSRFFE